MKMFTTSEQYKSIIADFKRKNKSLVQNCYYMFDEVKKLIEEKRLYYTVTEDALLIFRDEGKYYYINFMASKDFKGIKIYADKPCTTRIISKDNSGAQKATECREMAERLGLLFINCYRMYEINVNDRLMCLKEIYTELLRSLNQSGFVIRQYEECYFSEVERLWNQYLIKFNIPNEDWVVHIKNSILIVNVGSENKLCGVVMPRPCSNDNICHVVVDPLYRGRKMGVLLYYNLLEVLRAKGYKTAYQWIADDNISFINCQKKYFHIKATGFKSYQYVI